MTAPNENAFGYKEVQELRSAGFTDQEINDHVNTESQELSNAGFGEEEISQHWGKTPVDNRDFKQMAERIYPEFVDDENYAKIFATGMEAGVGFPLPDFFRPPWVSEEDFGIGLLGREKLPDLEISENAEWDEKLVYGLGVLASDLPWFVAGGALGTASGLPTGPGAVLAGTAAAFALPAGMRHIITETYANGQIATPGEFFDRAISTLAETSKGYGIGLATGGASVAVAATGPMVRGFAAGPYAGGAVLPTVSKTAQQITLLASLSAQATTMTVAGGAVEGHIPTVEDLTLAAATIGVLHGTFSIPRTTRTTAGILLSNRARSQENKRMAQKFSRIYVRTGIHPKQVLQEASRDHSILEDLLSTNITIPRALHSRIEGVDPLLISAAESVAQRRTVSVSRLQRDIRVTRLEAEVLIGELEALGIVDSGSPIYRANREVLKTVEEAREIVDAQSIWKDPSKVVEEPARPKEGEKAEPEAEKPEVSPKEPAAELSPIEAEVNLRLARKQDLRRRVGEDPNEFPGDLAEIRLEVVAEDIGRVFSGIEVGATSRRDKVPFISEIVKEFAQSNVRGEDALDSFIWHIFDPSRVLSIQSPEALAFRSELKEAILYRLRGEGLLSWEQPTPRAAEGVEVLPKAESRFSQEGIEGLKLGDKEASADIWGNVKTGEGVELDVHRGSGREDTASIYAADAEGPALGEGRYSALDSSAAKMFGPKVETLTVRLENPYVLESDGQIKTLAGMGKSDSLPMEVSDWVPILKKVRSAIESLGHDGVIVNVRQYRDFDKSAGIDSVKRLREVFGDSQVIEFPKKPPTPRAAVSTEDLSALPYRELQQRAKEAGIKANQKKADLVAELEARPVEEVPAEVPREVEPPKEPEPPRQRILDEESLPEQIAEARRMIDEVDAADRVRLKSLQRRLSALTQRWSKEKDSPGSPSMSSEGQKALDTVLSHIDIDGKPPKRNWSFSRFYRDWKDKDWFLRKTEDRVGIDRDTESIMDQPYKLARLLLGVRGKVTHFLEFGTYDFKTWKQTGRSLKDIVKPVNRNLDKLRGFLVAARRLELYERGVVKYGHEEMEAILRKIKDVPIAESRRVVEELRDEFEPIANEIYEFQRLVLEYYRDSGWLTPEAYELIREMNKNYVSFGRTLEDLDPSHKTRGHFIRRIDERGSELKINDPIDSMIKNTYSMIYAAEKNALSDAFIGMLEKRGFVEGNDWGGEVIATRKKARIKKIKIGDEEIRRLTEKMKDGELLTDKERLALEDIEFDIFRPDLIIPGKNEIVRMKNGEREIWEVPSEIAEIFESASRAEIGILGKILAAPARTLRAGAVLNPDFMMRNPIRDTMIAFLQSKNGFKFFADSAWGAFAVANKTDIYKQYMKSGASMSELVAIDRLYLRSDMSHVTGGTWDTGYWRNVRNVVLTPIEGLRVLSQFSEQMTRVGEFGRALRKDKGTFGLAKETSEDAAVRLRNRWAEYFDAPKSWQDKMEMLSRPAAKEDIMQAGLEARDITVDFGRFGARAMSVNRIVAFFNANLEASDIMFRTLAKRPIRTTIKGIMTLTIPSLILRHLNEGEYLFDDLPQWQKDMFWLVPIYKEDENGNVLPAPDGSGRPWAEWLRFPKPWTYGMLFATMAERGYDHIISKDPRAFEDWFETIVHSFTPSVLPTAIIPVFETQTNKSVFTGAPIVPESQSDLLPQMQIKQGTTSISRKLGEVLSSLPGGLSQWDAPLVGPIEETFIASPSHIDNFVRAWTGGLGTKLVHLLSKTLERAGVVPVPLDERADYDVNYFGLDAFKVRNGNPQTVEDFYNTIEHNERIFRSVDEAGKRDDPALVLDIIKNHPEAYTPEGYRIQIPRILKTIRELNRIRYMLPYVPDRFSQEELTFYQDFLVSRRNSLIKYGYALMKAAAAGEPLPPYEPREEEDVEYNDLIKRVTESYRSRDQNLRDMQ